MDRDLIARYRFFRKHADERPAYALRLARAEKRAGELGLYWDFDHEDEPWDGDCPAPRYDVIVSVRKQGAALHRASFASLGHVGVNSLDDPYLRVVAAELFDEVLSRPDYQRGAPGAVCTTGEYERGWGPFGARCARNADGTWLVQDPAPIPMRGVSASGEGP